MTVKPPTVGSTLGLREEGYWRETYPDSPYANHPMPVPQDAPWEGQEAFLTKLATVQSRAKEHSFRGFSTCRICGARNGSREYTFNGWKWPSGFRHYIADHNVEPSAGFKKMILEA